MILCGLWFSKNKPTVNFFLKQVVNGINSLYKTGKYVYLQFFKHYIIIGSIPLKVLLLTLISGQLCLRLCYCSAQQTCQLGLWLLTRNTIMKSMVVFIFIILEQQKVATTYSDIDSECCKLESFLEDTKCFFW